MPPFIIDRKVECLCSLC